MPGPHPGGWEALAIRLAHANDLLTDTRISLAEAIQHSPRVFHGAPHLTKALVLLADAQNTLRAWLEWAQDPSSFERKERLQRENQEKE